MGGITSNQVLVVEKEVTSELRRLSGLGVYPGAELAQIRREHGALASEWRQVIMKLPLGLASCRRLHNKIF